MVVGGKTVTLVVSEAKQPDGAFVVMVYNILAGRAAVLDRLSVILPEAVPEILVVKPDAVPLIKVGTQKNCDPRIVLLACMAILLEVQLMPGILVMLIAGLC